MIAFTILHNRTLALLLLHVDGCDLLANYILRNEQNTRCAVDEPFGKLDIELVDMYVKKRR